MPATITVDLNPVLFASGAVVIRWYGAFMSLAIFIGAWLALRQGVRAGFGEDLLLAIAIWSIPSGLIGARLFHLLDALEYYTTYPARVFAIQEGGLSLYGGLAGGFLAGILVARRKRVLSWRLLDAVTPAILLGQAIGRLGSFVNGDDQGYPAQLPWATAYANRASLAPDPLPRHPAQMYEFLFDLLLLGFLWAIRGRVKREGTVFLAYLTLYAFGRLCISAFREDTPMMFGMAQGQLLSVVAIAIAAALAMRVRGMAK